MVFSRTGLRGDKLRTTTKIILVFICLIAAIAIDNGPVGAQTYNAVFITGIDAQPNPVMPGTTTTITINTFEFAQWFWLDPTTMARPTIIANIAGKPFIADMTSEQMTQIGFWGSYYYWWYVQDGTWIHQFVWDGKDLQGNLVPPGAYLATVNVYAGGAYTFGSVVVQYGSQSVKITNITNITPPSCINATKNPCVEPTVVALYLHDEDDNPTGDDIAVTGQALQNGTDISDQISWTCISTPNPPDNPSAYTDGGTCYFGRAPIVTGATVTFIPNPPPALTGRTAPLSYQITAQINVTGVPSQDTKIITQDKLDELRQEYEDFPDVASLERDKFDQVVPEQETYARLLDPPDIEGTRFFTSENIGWHIVKDLIPHAEDLDVQYQSGNLYITAGYRTPRGNLLAKGVSTSLHMYGRALDFNQGSDEENYNVWLVANRTNQFRVRLLYDQENMIIPERLIIQNGTNIGYQVCHLKHTPQCYNVEHYTHGHVDWMQ